MNPLEPFGAVIERVLELVHHGEAEVFVSFEAGLYGYRATYFDMTKSFGNWLAYPEQEAPELLPEPPLIWFNDRMGGEAKYSATGFGFFPALFNAGGPSPKVMRDWQATPDTVARHCGEFRVADLYRGHHSFPSRIIPLLQAMAKSCRNMETRKTIEAQLGVLDDDKSGTVWLFCCSADGEPEPSATSSDGFEAMATNFRARIQPTAGRREVVFMLGGRAYQMLLDQGGWSIKEQRVVTGLKRPMPANVAWFRTGGAPEWCRLDDGGFGIALDGETSELLDFLTQFPAYRTTRRVVRDPNTEPFGSPFTLLAALAGFPKGKCVDGFRTWTSSIWSLCRPFSQAQQVQFWSLG